MNREQFKAPSVQAAAADLIANRALAQATRAEVDRIETALLATQPLRVNQDYLALGLVPSITNPTPPITDPADTWMASDPDFWDYLQRKHDALTAAGYVIEAMGQCPALIAEHRARVAEWGLIDAAGEAIGDAGLCRESAATLPSAQYRNLVDALLQLAINAMSSPRAQY